MLILLTIILLIKFHVTRSSHLFSTRRPSGQRGLVSCILICRRTKYNIVYQFIIHSARTNPKAAPEYLATVPTSKLAASADSE